MILRPPLRRGFCLSGKAASAAGRRRAGGLRVTAQSGMASKGENMAQSVGYGTSADMHEVDVLDPKSVEAWATALNVDTSMIFEAVELVGPAPEAIRAYLS
jgi:hypothetical protein